MNGAPAPLADDEDSDFGHESWYDCKDDKKGKAKGRRDGKRREPRKAGVDYRVDGDDDRVTNFSLLGHDFPFDESDEELFFDSQHREPRSRYIPAHSLISLSRCRNAGICLGKTGSA
jgi:hypothetical protein